MNQKRRRNSLRLKGFNYGATGAYFITICCQDRIPFLSTIIKGRVCLSPIGKILEEEWVKTEEIRENVQLDRWVIMPNHFHALVWIRRGELQFDPTGNPNNHIHQSTGYESYFKSPKANLSSIIRGFKGSVTRRARAAGFTNFGWQRSFHDRIVRDEQELIRIRQYILNNPSNWDRDNNYLGRL